MFSQVNVFSSDSFGGNPVAVVHDADNLSTDQMQTFARWTNLAETTFILSPSAADADYRLRIFTTDGELPFAGHPTLGSCRAWLDATRPSLSNGQIVQECGIGKVVLRVEDERVAFAAPPLRRNGPVDPDVLASIVAALGIREVDVVDAAWVDNGPPWIGILLRDATAVLAMRPDFVALGGHCVGVIGAHAVGGPTDVEVRAFWPGAREDPVTGSLNAGLAIWLMDAGVLPEHYVVAQGAVLARTGQLHIDRDSNGTVWVSGTTSTRVRGTVEF
ncbi:phenazine biosynthesis protein PhzF [Mycobacteroides chelonae]|nr:phenazine biosynthesis protein PhzF [Mycobacteroides chelonae]